jgi:hypothetical protein
MKYSDTGNEFEKQFETVTGSNNVFENDIKNIMNNKINHNVYNDDDVTDESLPNAVLAENVMTRDRVRARKNKILDFNDYLDEMNGISEQKNNTMIYPDLCLYLISGVVLIFMMEQFIKIGMLLA